MSCGNDVWQIVEPLLVGDTMIGTRQPVDRSISCTRKLIILAVHEQQMKLCISIITTDSQSQILAMKMPTASSLFGAQRGGERSYPTSSAEEM